MVQWLLQNCYLVNFLVLHVWQLILTNKFAHFCPKMADCIHHRQLNHLLWQEFHWKFLEFLEFLEPLEFHHNHRNSSSPLYSEKHKNFFNDLLLCVAQYLESQIREQMLVSDILWYENQFWAVGWAGLWKKRFGPIISNFWGPFFKVSWAKN